MTPANAKALTDGAVILSLTIKRPGLRRKVDVRDLNEYADPRMVKASKIILESTAYQKICKLDSTLRWRIGMLALPCSFVRPGMYILAATTVADAEDIRDTWLAERAQLVAELRADYEAAQERARQMLEPSGLYNEGDYLTIDELAARFGYEWAYMGFDVPGALKSVSKIVHQRAVDATRKRLEAAAEEIEQGLRAQFLELAEHFAEMLAPTEDGKARSLRDSFLERFDGFCEAFASRDLFGDVELKKLVERAREAAHGVSLDALRKGKSKMEAREVLRERFAAIAAEARKQVDTTERAFSLADDDEEA